MITVQTDKFFEDMCIGYFVHHQRKYSDATGKKPERCMTWTALPPHQKEQFKEAMKAAFNHAWSNATGGNDGGQVEPPPHEPEVA